MKKIELKKDKKVNANKQKNFKSILPEELNKIKGGEAVNSQTWFETEGFKKTHGGWA